jgi:hypothetical protein
MSRWPGNLIRKTPVTPAGPFQNGAASGVWSLADAAYWTKQGLWPIAGNVLDGTFGIFALGIAGGVRSTTRDKYTYSGCVVAAGGAATVASALGSAAGNSTVGIFALGFNACFANTTTRNKYTYSGCVVSAGGAATAASSGGSATGNSTVGIFALGCAGSASTTRNKYTYSGCVVSAGGAATAASYYSSAASNGIAGITL